MTKIIYTFSPSSEPDAKREIKLMDPSFHVLKTLEPGVCLAETDQTWKAFAAMLIEKPPIWTRHIQPVLQQLTLNKDAGDLVALESVLPGALQNLDTGFSFSVQTRLLGEGVRWAYSRFDINERLSTVISSWGSELDVREPAQVLSVVCTEDEAYLGLSYTSHNISSWAGGERRFRKETGQTSRAEFKLLEAMEIFNIQLPEDGRVLDLGASPGGWTRIMAGQGLKVTAVDPASMDPEVMKLAGVKHIKSRIQEIELKGTFDVILNDMRMDARDSARLMRTTAHLLEPGGFGLMTLKLPEKSSAQTADFALRLLATAWTIRGARQLFHNRSEVTVYLGKIKEE